jgi:hypothetical protein
LFSIGQLGRRLEIRPIKTNRFPIYPIAAL